MFIQFDDDLNISAGKYRNYRVGNLAKLLKFVKSRHWYFKPMDNGYGSETWFFTPSEIDCGFDDFLQYLIQEQMRR